MAWRSVARAAWGWALAAAITAGLWAQQVEPARAALPLAGKVVAVDPGHGGSDSGTVGVGGVKEKAINLAIALALKPLLEADGARTVYTRTTDTDVGPGVRDERMELQRRCDVANAAHADVFISIHANQINDPNFNGAITFFGPDRGYITHITRPQALVTPSYHLGRLIQSQLVAATGEVDRGVDDAPFYVLGYTSMPAVLVEVGFMSNAAEAQNLSTPAYQQKVARGILQGVKAYFSGAGDALPPFVPAPAPPVGPDARFVSDVTFPDNSPVYARETVKKTWRVENSGGVAWPRGTVLAFKRGNQLGGPATVPVPQVPPGDATNVTVSLQIPPDLPLGPASGTWQLQDPAGNAFGDPLWIKVVMGTPPPTAPTTPGKGAGVRFFPDTGHNVLGAFLRYFNGHGGLEAFGFPRTEELQEDGFTVQYFQRARFEYHPDKAGTPYEVQLTLLGDLATRNRQPFPKSPPFASGKDHQYFPQTGHAVSFAFLRYFNAHGGVDSFGYPISEELQETNGDGSGTVYSVQYFQRARFEYHPDKAGTPYEVQLGLLGDEALVARGWLSS